MVQTFRLTLVKFETQLKVLFKSSNERIQIKNRISLKSLFQEAFKALIHLKLMSELDINQLILILIP